MIDDFYSIVSFLDVLLILMLKCYLKNFMKKQALVCVNSAINEPQKLIDSINSPNSFISIYKQFFYKKQFCFRLNPRRGYQLLQNLRGGFSGYTLPLGHHWSERKRSHSSGQQLWFYRFRRLHLIIPRE